MTPRLNKKQKKRLAKEMRGLAMECIDNGPEMKDDWCGCAVGISMKRAGVSTGGMWRDCGLAEDIDLLMPDGSWPGVVTNATRERIYRANPTAVVFPLLALADALEASASEAP